MQDHHRGGLFFLLLTIGGLLFPRDQSENPHACRIAGIGLAFVYLSGLQPVTVYQFALTLLGVLLLQENETAPMPRNHRARLHNN